MAIIKFFHIVAMLVWVGSLLAACQLLSKRMVSIPFQQHMDSKRIQRLYVAIELPAAFLSIALGFISLFLKGVNWRAPWLHMKLLFVFCLLVCEIFVALQVFFPSAKAKSKSVYRLFQGLVTLCFLGILVAVYVVKKKI